ncbi:putative reverse transcriptase domain-containing protein [Tanacetum coccineum]
MTTTNQGMSFAEIKQIVAERVDNAIETIAIYETKTSMARESMSQAKQQDDKVAENTSNRRKWEVKYGNYKRFGYETSDCRTPVLGAKQRPSVAKQKAEVTCYECGILGHYQSNCPMWKFRKHVNKYCKEKALKDSSVAANNVDV